MSQKNFYCTPYPTATILVWSLEFEILINNSARAHQSKNEKEFLIILILRNIINPLMSGGNKKVTHTKTNLQLKVAGLFKYV